MGELRIFFATDLHGSDRCFRKFINAAQAYRASVIVIGGDITGKAIVPFIEYNGEITADYLGQKVQVRSRDQLERYFKEASDAGYYPVLLERGEYERISGKKEEVERLFLKLMKERAQAWIRLAEERLRNTGIRVIINAGNDDAFEIDEVLDSSDFVEHPEGKVIELDGYEMISTGYANMTPWRAPRDIPDEALRARIMDMINRLKNPSRAIFNIHPPPYNTGLDMAPKLDDHLRPVTASGSMLMEPVGSRAVRELEEEYQPLLGLHGHVHESRNARLLGKTLVINPGSDYQYGILRGVAVNLENGGVKNYMLTTG